PPTICQNATTVQSKTAKVKPREVLFHSIGTVAPIRHVYLGVFLLVNTDIAVLFSTMLTKHKCEGSSYHQIIFSNLEKPQSNVERKEGHIPAEFYTHD
ncbi:hypothetical protein QUG67_22400, partial [Enterobacter hormaechei]|uniref:hypothetical protein n=1 Tax=Enterobacter hormaechei TaxID=158836 RepID=UPI0025A20B9D